MTSIDAIMVTLMPTLKVCLFVAITLKASIKNNLSKSWRFSMKMSVVEFRYSKTIIFGIHSKFTYDSETYDIVKLYLFINLNYTLF